MQNFEISHRSVVYPRQCDHMGHMNVMWYTGKFDEATWHLFSWFGITPSYLNQKQRGMAGVQQNTTYKRELYAGDIITIRSGVLEIREKVIRFIHEMKNEETGEIAAYTVLTAVHLDRELHKSSSFPEEVRKQAEKMIIEYEGA